MEPHTQKTNFVPAHNLKGRHGPTSSNYSLHLKDGDSVQDHIKAMTENINEMD
jgi:hypothetical protein